MSGYEPFAAIYDRWSADLTEDTARLAAEVARATGQRVIGIDSSSEMICASATCATSSWTSPPH